jgi:hypothetical protein
MFAFTSFKSPLPPSVKDILDDPDAVHRRYPIRNQRSWRISCYSFLGFNRVYPDTMSSSFYRLYECLVASWVTQFRNELEYFCTSNPTWAVSALPDPEDPDPLRYAILAVLTRLMCDAFNRRVDVGLPRDAPAIVSDFAALAARPKVYEQPPAWAGRVPPLSERVFIPDEKGAISDENDEEVSEEFKAMNIIMLRPHIHFI